MSDPKHCAQCGAELPADAPGGHCLNCLLQLGLSASEPAEKPGDRIGRYKLLQKIGEGGCGVVYMAEQEEPVRRRVALKIIKLGMDTRQVIARFEAERQALALMDHPNIAKVLDAGATEKGRPYFVMELVAGMKITDYCDQQRFTTQRRLELFIDVCRAVQHAHQKGIIHRDLKPSNILVTEQDGRAVPKIIDFGIAKATAGQPLTDKTLFTAFEQFIGTPAYMSPEQAGLGKLDVDTRSDIYSLGVLLYELLTGRPPFDSKELQRSAIDEVLRTIRETEPPRPSNKITTLSEQELTVTAQQRQTEPIKLSHLLRGDLDWIVMKAMDKDRNRRYSTASGLARDIECHLADQPVAACPPSSLYQLRKLVQRHKQKLVVTGTIAGAVVVMNCSYVWIKPLVLRDYARIQIDSFPSGAEVWRDQQKVGTTPYQNERARPGMLNYELRLTGHEPYRGSIQLKGNVASRLMVVLGNSERTTLNPGGGWGSMATNRFAESTLLTFEGVVETSPFETREWRPVRTNQVLFLFAGDRLRTAARSRGTLRMSDSTVLHIGELTTVEITPPTDTNKSTPGINLTRGTISFFHTNR